MAQGKKALKRYVVSTFKDLKKPVARKSLFEEIVEPLREQMNNKTQELSETFCVNCHNYKKEIDKLLRKKLSSKFPLTNWKKY